VIVALAFLAIASTSCSSPYRRPQLTPPEIGFSGIADALKTADPISVAEVDV
jgi:hypothetical protein